MPRLEITLKADGTVKVEGKEFVGDACKEASAFMDKLFGEAEHVDLKEEYHLREAGKDAITTGWCG